MASPSFEADPRKDSERLPWLDDVPRSDAPRNTRTLVASITGILIVVAGASYWAGLRSAAPSAPPVSDRPQSQITVELPDFSEPVTQPIPEINTTTAQAPASPADAIILGSRAKPAANTGRDRGSGSNAKAVTGSIRSMQANDPYPLWPSDKVEGAEGRLVRIGDFQSTADAQDGWQKVLGEYPGMVRLKPIVTTRKSLRDGRTFYSLQLGTSSQAHSQVVCERSIQLQMRCAVVGLIVSETR